MVTFSQLGRYGRFGNQLFQIASTIGIAVKHGYAYAFPEWINHDHKERFGSTEDVSLSKYFLYKLPTSNLNLPDFPVAWGYHHDLRIPDCVSLSGHLQSDKYFSHCKPHIDRVFTMTDEPDQTDDIAIHWRLGDYDDHYHARLTMDYYLKAVEAIPGNDPMLIFSDDKDRALQLAVQLEEITGRQTAVSLNRDYITDFRIMKTCKHFICGNSSYSLMAAILGRHPGKKIICPSKWFGPAWRPDTKDLYPEKAIII